MRQANSVSQPPTAIPAATHGCAGADPVVTRWIRRALAADPPRAKSLIVTVWGDALAPHGGAVWLAGLIRLMAPLRINERSVRTSVFRLGRDGWLAATAVGRVSRYALTREGARRFDDAHRRIYDRPVETWDGAWDLVLADRVATAHRGPLREELRWAGYGELSATTFVRPRLQPQAPPSILAARGIAGAAIVTQAVDIPGQTPLATAAGAAWDLPALAADYRRFLQHFGTVIERFRNDGEHDPEQCFVVRTLLVHAYRRVLLRDPLLPAALLPMDWPGAAAYALCRDFYRLTHGSAERHLASTLATPGTALPPANAAFRSRFGGLAEA
jgi:phenylacetic acid degradation operon negative regulatory protein